MGSIRTGANSVFRDYATNGVPDSGVNDPDKSLIRSLFGTVEDAIATATSSAAIPVESSAPSAVPAAPVTGQRWIVSASAATGAWAGKANSIAQWDGSAWTFVTPENVYAVVSKQDEAIFIWDGASWVNVTAPTLAFATYADMTGGEYRSAPDGVAFVYADADTNLNGLYRNVGSFSTPSWQRLSALKGDKGDPGPQAVKIAVKAANAVALPSFVYSAGVMTASANGDFPAIDGVTLSVGDRFWHWDYTGAGGGNVAYGIYTLTNAGSGSTKWTATRATDADTAAELGSCYAYVKSGSTLQGVQLSVIQTIAEITLGSTAIKVTQVYSDAAATTAALATKADVNSPTLTGTPAAPTPAAGDTSTNIATMEAVARELWPVGSTRADMSSATMGSTTSNSANCGNTYLWGRAEPNLKDGWLRSVTVRLSAAGVGSIVVLDASGAAIFEQAVTAAASGLNTFTFQNTYIPAGARVMFKWTSGGQLRYVSSGGAAVVLLSSSYAGVGSRYALTYSANVDVAMSYVVDYATSDTVSRQASSAKARALDAAGAGARDVRAASVPTFLWPAGSPTMVRIAEGFDTGADITPGTIITGIAAYIITPAAVSTLTFEIYSRSTSSGSIDSAPVLSEDVLIQSVVKTPAECGLIADDTTARQASALITPFAAAAGTSYFVVVTARDANGNLTALGVGGAAPTPSRQRRRGWYATSYGSYTAVSSSYSMSLGLLTQLAQPVSNVLGSTLDRIDSATISWSGLVLTTNIIVNNSGAPFAVGETRTFTAASSSKVRYDTLYYDIVSGSFGVAAGTEATNDAAERPGALTASTQVVIARVRVTDAAVTDAVPMWRVSRGGDPQDLVVALEDERRRSRACLTNTMARIASGKPLKVVSIGDSILAMENTTTGGGSTTANGSNRDRAQEYLSSKIGSDLYGALPLYTSLQLGRADDGAGAVHTKWGEIWDGFVTPAQNAGVPVSYDNFCWGGKSSADAMSGGSVGAWVTNAIALGPQLVFVHFGQNENGSTATEGNLTKIAQAFMAAGADVVLMGVPGRTAMTDTQYANWLYTNNVIARVAKFVGCAHIPTGALYDPRYLGVFGISALDTATANRINHPGIIEKNRIAAEVLKLFQPLLPTSTARGFRNLLRNSRFNINQRLKSGTVTLAAGEYGHDGLRGGASGASYTFMTVGGDTQITITSGSLVMPIEAGEITPDSYALSHEGTATARVWQGTGYTGSGTYQAASRSAPLIAPGLSGSTQTNVEFTGGTILRPQFERGVSASLFERLPIALEIDWCRRYYRTSYGFSPPGTSGATTQQIVYQLDGAWAAGAALYLNIYFENMRTTPTATIYSPTTGAPGMVRVGAADVPAHMVVSPLGIYSLVNDSGGSVGSAGGTVLAMWELSAELP